VFGGGGMEEVVGGGVLRAGGMEEVVGGGGLRVEKNEISITRKVLGKKMCLRMEVAKEKIRNEPDHPGKGSFFRNLRQITAWLEELFQNGDFKIVHSVPDLERLILRSYFLPKDGGIYTEAERP
jgi:hypothetical protein